MSSTFEQRACSSLGEQDDDGERLGRDTATLSRLRENRNARPRDTSSPDDAVIEKNTTGASCPWNLSNGAGAHASRRSTRCRQRTCAL